MRLGAETWRNMVGGRIFSRLQSMLQKWSLQVLLGHISSFWQEDARRIPQDSNLQKYVDKYK